MVEERAHLGLVDEMEFEKKSMYIVDDDIYPPPLLSHMEVSTNQVAFFDTIRRFHSAMGTKFMIPVIGGKELNLHQLYVQVTQRGGLEKVILEKRWREVIATFNFPPTTTSASFVLRKYYLSLLHHYEQVYFFRTQGPLAAPTAILQTKTPLISKVDQNSDPTMRNKRAGPPKKRKVVPAASYIIQGQECLDSDDIPLPLTPVERKQATGVNGVAGSRSVVNVATLKSTQRVLPATPRTIKASEFVTSSHAAQFPTTVKRKPAAVVPTTSRTIKAKKFAASSHAVEAPTAVESKPAAVVPATPRRIKAKEFAASSLAIQAPTAVKSKPAVVIPATPCTIKANVFAASTHAAQAPTTVESKPAAGFYSVASATTSGESTPPLEPSAVLNADGIRVCKSTPPGPVYANTTFGERVSNVEHSAVSNTNGVRKSTVSNANGIHKSTPPSPVHVNTTFGEHVSNGTHNLKVSGTINGKFEYGYLVSVKLGTEILNGVLYHVPPQETAYSSLHQATPQQPLPVASPASINSPSNAIIDPYIPQTRSVQRRRKYKNRAPDHPKPNRSAYNFFFAETHAKLKVQYPHKEREYSKMIGESWGKLTAEERKVFNDYGKRDKERYRRELEEYRERTRLVQPRGVLRIREAVRETEDAKSKEVEMVEAK